jgi:outer membrane protein TolC
MEAVAADMRAELLQALAEWVFIGQARAVVAENHRLVGQLEEVARRQYQTGNASQADVLRLQMEQASLAADIQDWEARRLPARARLNAIIGRPAATPLPPIATLPFALLPEAAVDTLAALPANPELRQRQSRVREAESARELARRAARPDFMLGIEYMDNRRMERDEVLASAAITIPLWRGRYQALTREATAGLRAARQEYQASRDRLAADAHALFYEIGDSDRRLRLFADNLLPRARQTLAIVEADYQTGRAGFLDLLEAQRAVLAFELGQARAATDHFQRLAAWERLVGPFADPATDTLHSPADQ